jgi:hypothetical protein
MTIGGGILLFVIGAILAFAVDVNIPGIEDNTLGYILMLAGVLVAVLSLALTRRSHRTVAVTHDAAGRQAVTERRTDSSGGPVV